MQRLHPHSVCDYGSGKWRKCEEGTGPSSSPESPTRVRRGRPMPGQVDEGNDRRLQPLEARSPAGPSESDSDVASPAGSSTGVASTAGASVHAPAIAGSPASASWRRSSGGLRALSRPSVVVLFATSPSACPGIRPARQRPRLGLIGAVSGPVAGAAASCGLIRACPS
jgi:hypothetical protein